MSSPLIKISDQSWSLSCLCCNCAQEVRDIVKTIVGPAFVEYNHRFTCPNCQTYNQILLTRDMFDNAQQMVFQSPPATRRPPGEEVVNPIANSPTPPLETNAPTDPSPAAFDDAALFNLGPAASESGGGSGILFDALDAPIKLGGNADPATPAPPTPASAPRLPEAADSSKTDSAKTAGVTSNLASNTNNATSNLKGKEPKKEANTGFASITSNKAKADEKREIARAQAGNRSGLLASLPENITVGGKTIPINNTTVYVTGGLAVLLIAVIYTFLPGAEPAPPPANRPAAVPAPAAAANKPKPVKPATPAPPPVPKALIEAKMIEIPGGEYLIGSNEGSEYERPTHKVTVDTFLMDNHEVTREEYRLFITATKHKPPPSWSNGQYSGNGQLPVTDVSWEDATAFAKWAGKRLPTEVEWEVAAAGRDHLLYPWGNDWKPDLANTKDAALDAPRPAGTFAKGISPFGLHDMCGNVWEWTASEPTTYPNSPGKKVPDAANFRVIRGGSYKDQKNIVTNSSRNWVETKRTDTALGFRCAQDKK
jgi:formylglycine-generating enzyme required for sulfatase activity